MRQRSRTLSSVSFASMALAVVFVAACSSDPAPQIMAARGGASGSANGGRSGPVAGAGGATTGAGGAGIVGVGGVGPGGGKGGAISTGGSVSEAGVGGLGEGGRSVDAARAERPEADAGGEAGRVAGPKNWCLPLAQHPQGVDWGKALIDARMRGGGMGWSYPEGLFMHGMYLAYKRLNDPRYFAYLKTWADGHSGAGSYNSLDSMQPTLVLVDVYRETKDPKYGAAPRAVATRLEGSYPKTSDGGFWHSTGQQNQLWGDGVFMNLPPYVNYGEQFGNAKAIDIATDQLIIYDKHLAAPNNLHMHQWNENTNRQSCCQWCRAEGWYEMALMMVLDFTPATHPDYQTLVAIAQRLAKGVAATQDPATGRWWQVMDRPNDAGNWLETSCTAMHTYFLSRGVEKGYLDAATYGPLAIKGFLGEMQQVSNPADPQIRNICPGTNVLGSPGEYYARPKATNDNHGTGAFLVMYDQLVCR